MRPDDGGGALLFPALDELLAERAFGGGPVEDEEATFAFDDRFGGELCVVIVVLLWEVVLGFPW